MITMIILAQDSRNKYENKNNTIHITLTHMSENVFLLWKSKKLEYKVGHQAL